MEFEWEEVGLGKGRKIRYNLRRVVDKKLIDGLSDQQCEAMEGIWRGWRVLISGLGYSGMRWDDAGGKGSSDIGSGILLRYMEWCDLVRDEVELDQVLRVICLGDSLNKVDKDRGVRKGTTSIELRKALDFWFAKS